MKRIVQVALIFVLVVLIFSAGGAGGVLLDRQVLLGYVPVSTINNSAAPDFQLMAQAWNLIQKVYVDRTAVNDLALTYGAISGMVDALGDTGHSRFMGPQMVKEEQSQNSGKFEGIGVEVKQKDGSIVIVAPFDNSPAKKAGLHAGDIILKVNGKDVTGLPLVQVTTMILGQAGTDVNLTVHDVVTNTIRDVTITRALITIQNVTWQPIPGTKIADVRVSAFSHGVTEDLKKTLQDVQNQGMTGIVLDLRDNPGGLLDEAVGVTSLFVQHGDVLLTRDAKGHITHLPVQPNGPENDLRMVVLINRGTASAAEIVSSALAAAGRATLVGETTFGTGTVLNQFNLTDGSALLLATEEWLTPDGQLIWHKGITPNVQVPLAANVYPLTPDGLRTITQAQLQQSGDAQLLQALNMILPPTASN